MQRRELVAGRSEPPVVRPAALARVDSPALGRASLGRPTGRAVERETLRTDGAGSGIGHGIHFRCHRRDHRYSSPDLLGRSAGRFLNAHINSAMECDLAHGMILGSIPALVSRSARECSSAHSYNLMMRTPGRCRGPELLNAPHRMPSYDRQAALRGASGNGPVHSSTRTARVSIALLTRISVGFRQPLSAARTSQGCSDARPPLLGVPVNPPSR